MYALRNFWISQGYIEEQFEEHSIVQRTLNVRRAQFVRRALEEYFIVLGFVKDKFKQENLQKIETRINNIKQIIGDGEFESISNVYCKQ